MKVYLIYFPNGSNNQWEAMSEMVVPDPKAFPKHWYKEYDLPKEEHEKAFERLRDIRNDMNKRKVLPTKERDIFPELSDILKST